MTPTQKYHLAITIVCCLTFLGFTGILGGFSVLGDATRCVKQEQVKR